MVFTDLVQCFTYQPNFTRLIETDMNSIKWIYLLLPITLFLSCSMEDTPHKENDWIKTIPKIHFHLHLDGSVRLNTIWDCRKRQY